MTTLEKRTAKARTALKAARDTFLDLQKELKNSNKCTHSETEPYTWLHDGGYGRETIISGKWCMLCMARDPRGDGRFHNEDPS